jgi:ectoine hydroxylase-related dioxygenase (phytanoyl-CoA dioxygenase family)
MKKEDNIDLKERGFTILRNVVSGEWLGKLSNSMEKSFENHRIAQVDKGINPSTTALHALLDDDVYIEFLQYLKDSGFIKELQENFFNSNCIINSFSALDNLKDNPNFSSMVHRDLRFYSGDFPIMINCLVMIDEFTADNGGTYLLSESHLSPERPTDEHFFKNAVQATGKAGDILIFNSNLWHASAPNNTSDHRRGIPITISKSFMKQLLDYPRAIGYERIDDFSHEIQQLLGYHSRVPASIDEWYQPEENRYYKKDQD